MKKIIMILMIVLLAASVYAPDDLKKLTVQTIGEGLVTSSDGQIDCGADCAAYYVNGDTVTLYATADVGSVFVGWGDRCSGTGDCYFEMGEWSQQVGTPYALITATFDLDPDYCDPVCINGDCSDRMCMCDAGWAGVDCTDTTCFGWSMYDPSVCSGVGNCIGPDICACSPGFTGLDCSQSDMCGFCVNGEYDVGGCMCYPGWTGIDCSIPICNTCMNGICVAPDACLCDEGFGSSACDKEVRYVPDPLLCGNEVINLGEECDEGVNNGKCILGTIFNASCDVCTDECELERLYMKIDVLDPCDPECQNDGVCYDESCYCTDGWTGVDCSEEIGLPVCDIDCAHGECLLDQDGAMSCGCDAGWTGSLCDVPICSNPFGSCIAPGVMSCNVGWQGVYCSEPICSCVNGECIAPGFCLCDDGWLGDDCSLEECVDLDSDGFCEDDCDENNPLINPSAVELPGNTVDENCDGILSCDPSIDWKNHGQFVSCVVKEAVSLRKDGLISNTEMSLLIRGAARR